MVANDFINPIWHVTHEDDMHETTGAMELLLGLRTTTGRWSSKGEEGMQVEQVEVLFKLGLPETKIGSSVPGANGACEKTLLASRDCDDGGNMRRRISGRNPWWSHDFLQGILKDQLKLGKGDASDDLRDRG